MALENDNSTSEGTPQVQDTNENASTGLADTVAGSTEFAGTGTTSEELSMESSNGFSPEYVRQLRNEAAQRRIRERELETLLATREAELAEHNQSNLSEWERLTSQLEQETTSRAQAEQAVLERELQYRIAVAAPRIGIVDPEAAVSLIDYELLTFGEDGSITNIDVALHDLVERKPYLKANAPAVPSPGATNPAATSRGSSLTLDDVKKMTAAEINSRWDEIGPLLQQPRK